MAQQNLALLDRTGHEFDPARLGFPPMLPVELAMRTGTVANICAGYSISREEFAEMVDDPLFCAAYQLAKDELKKDGVSFRMKAKMQAEALLQQSWKLIHSPDTPNTVKADLIKSTVKWAGYEPRGDVLGTGTGSAFQININLG